MKISALPRNNNNTLYSFILASIIYAFLIFSVFIVGKNFTSKDVGLQTQNLAISLNKFTPDVSQVQPLQPPLPQPEPIQKINKPLPKKVKPKHHRKETKMIQPLAPQEVLESHIPEDAFTPAPTNDTPSMLTFGKNNDPFLLAIKQAIDKNLHYPRKARMMRAEGIVTVEFTLLASGGVRNVKVIDSSGNPILDKSAIRTILDAQESFPLAKNNVIIQIPIQYHLKS